jgi:uncharacterized protein (TIGR02646 family)
MLNIANRISLSKRAKRAIRNHWKESGGVLDSKSWAKIPNPVKSEISEKLLHNQALKCAYCERYLYAKRPEIDHFAHKGMFPRFSFNPTNLFYSCNHCNSSGMKGQKNTVAISHDRYHLVTFKIVHPYRDNPEDHIRFRDHDRIDLDVANCTYKGKRTIVFFKYHEILMTMIRSRDLMLDRLRPLSTGQEAELIQECITYRQ